MTWSKKIRQNLIGKIHQQAEFADFLKKKILNTTPNKIILVACSAVFFTVSRMK